MKRQIDDAQLTRILEAGRTRIEADDVRRVRTSILVAVHSVERFSWASALGFRPALLVATGLIGFMLGVSLPALGSGQAGSATVFEDQPQSFLTGDLG